MSIIADILPRRTYVPPPTAVESFLEFLQTWLVVVSVVGLAIFGVYLFFRYRKSQSGNVPPHESNE